MICLARYSSRCVTPLSGASRKSHTVSDRYPPTLPPTPSLLFSPSGAANSHPRHRWVIADFFAKESWCRCLALTRMSRSAEYPQFSGVPPGCIRSVCNLSGGRDQSTSGYANRTYGHDLTSSHARLRSATRQSAMHASVTGRNSRRSSVNVWQLTRTLRTVASVTRGRWLRSRRASAGGVAVTGEGIGTGRSAARLAADDDASGAFATSPSPSPSLSPSPPPPQRGRSVSSVTRSKNPSAIFRRLRVPHSSANVSRRYPCDSSSSPVSPRSNTTVSSVSANPNNRVHPSTRVCRIPSTVSTMAAGIGVDRVSGGRGTPTHVGESSCQHRHAAVSGTFGTSAKSRTWSLVAPAARHTARMRTSSAHRSIVSSTSAAGIAGGSRVVSRSTAAHASTHSARRVRGLGSSRGRIRKFRLPQPS
mmetsp:Transcript_7513/g.30991  ORF Transcript_7513/g.30991 Transcript_7513/m.30991 type:complete len:419 (+) Transcript_7513:386-1642(+)